MKARRQLGGPSGVVELKMDTIYGFQGSTPGQAAENGNGFPTVHCCPACGEIFCSKRNDAKTCSPRCRQRLSRGIRKAMKENGVSDASV